QSSHDDIALEGSVEVNEPPLEGDSFADRRERGEIEVLDAPRRGDVERVGDARELGSDFGKAERSGGVVVDDRERRVERAVLHPGLMRPESVAERVAIVEDGARLIARRVPKIVNRIRSVSTL